MIRSPEVLHVTEHLVGIESRTEELISTLRLDYKDHVIVVGVSGISGIAAAVDTEFKEEVVSHAEGFPLVLKDEERAFFPDVEFRFLVDRSLVEKTTGLYKWSMPWAIKEMAKEIVRQENEDEPGQRTRLWMKSDVMRVLTECSGTKSVESIHLVIHNVDENVIVQVEALRKMSNLRLLRINVDTLLKPRRGQIFWSGSSHDEMASPLSFCKLQCMWWSQLPFKSFNHIDMANVVVIRVEYSNLEILWEGMK
ncbi:hypothetical protein M8C21_008084, partial [Ambrosia artemisiifolia]